MKKKYLLALAVIMNMQVIAYAQQPEQQKNTNWQQYYKNAQVEIDYRYADCNLPSEGLNEENVYLQFKNLTNTDILITFEIEARYGDKCYNCEGGNKEYIKNVKLTPRQTLAGDCSGIISSEFKILSKLKNTPNLPVLSDFKVKNVSSIEINLSK